MSLRQFMVLSYVLMVLASCGFKKADQLRPLQDSIEHEDVTVTLQSNTNCAERGQSILFTLTIQNDREQPITFMDTPPFNIVLSTRDDPTPQFRWSEANTYPQDIPQTVQPDETKTYTWEWQAPPDFQSNASEKGIIVGYEVRIRLNDRFQYIFGQDSILYIGYEEYEYHTGDTPCVLFSH